MVLSHWGKSSPSQPGGFKRGPRQSLPPTSLATARSNRDLLFLVVCGWESMRKHEKAMVSSKWINGQTICCLRYEAAAFTLAMDDFKRLQLTWCQSLQGAVVFQDTAALFPWKVTQPEPPPTCLGPPLGMLPLPRHIETSDASSSSGFRNAGAHAPVLRSLWPEGLPTTSVDIRSPSPWRSSLANGSLLRHQSDGWISPVPFAAWNFPGS